MYQCSIFGALTNYICIKIHCNSDIVLLVHQYHSKTQKTVGKVWNRIQVFTATF